MGSSENERLQLDLAASRSAADTLAGARDRLYREVERLREEVKKAWDVVDGQRDTMQTQLAEVERLREENDHLRHVIYDALKWLDPGDGLTPAVDTAVAVLRTQEGR